MSFIHDPKITWQFPQDFYIYIYIIYMILYFNINSLAIVMHFFFNWASAFNEIFKFVCSNQGDKIMETTFALWIMPFYILYVHTCGLIKKLPKIASSKDVTSSIWQPVIDRMTLWDSSICMLWLGVWDKVKALVSHRRYMMAEALISRLFLFSLIEGNIYDADTECFPCLHSKLGV